MATAWVRTAAERLVIHLADLGITVRRQAAEELIQARWDQARGDGLAPGMIKRAVTDEVIHRWATDTAFAIVDERPGADPLSLQRTATLTRAQVTTTIWALAEAAKVLASTPTGSHPPVACIAEFAAIQADQDSSERESDPVALPPAVLRRAVRLLQSAAHEVVHVTDDATPPGVDRCLLSEMFLTDAEMLVTAADR